jgi:transcriptional regulatory protein GAL4
VISKPFPAAEELLALESQCLEPWVAGLPSYFQEDSSIDMKYTFPQAVMQWRYRNFRIIMYRPIVIRIALNARFLREETSEANIEAYSRCLGDAAWSIKSISEYWTTHEHNCLAAWYAL